MEAIRKSKRELLSVLSFCLTFLLGWALTICGFFIPPQGEVSDSVLFILGQCMLYCAALLGISSHYENKLDEFKQKINDRLSEKN